ncbi:MAG: InlB B-repeat-containing protein [Christensenellales bacterium]|jgi:hypothetical surface-anchored protein
MKKFRFLLTAILFAIVLCAVSACGKDIVKLSFETNGGSSIETVEVKKGESYELPVPTRTGYEFDGWFTDENFSGSAVTSTTPESNLTFYAKWTQLYTVTLDLDGGSLSTTSLSLKAGVNLYNAVKELAPSKANHQFGGWFKGDDALSESAVMPSENVTLKAKYKVAYTVELYLQDIEDETKYVKADNDVTGYDWAGTQVSPDEKVEGFDRVIGHESEIASKTLSANASANVFKLYFDRKTLFVFFDAGEDFDDISFEVKYGEEVTVPVNFESEGKLLVGWTADGGETIYKTNVIYSLLRNLAQVSDTEPESFIPQDDMVFEAVWSVGLVDMFEGEDYIFLDPDDAEVVYLYRGGEYFIGSLNTKNNEFRIRNLDEDIVITGKVNENGTFVFQDNGNSNMTYDLFVSGVGVNSDIFLQIDRFDGISYVEKDEKGIITVERQGYYTVDESGIYTAHFSDGGDDFNFIVGTAGGTDAFQIRNEEEYALGRDNGGLVRFAINDGQLVYFTSVYQMLLDGFGTAVINMGTSTSAYRYTYDTETQLITLRTSMGIVAGVFQIMSGTSVQGYVIYDESSDKTYESENSQATFTMDGLYSATYFDGTTTLKGVYQVVGTSVLGGSIIRFYSEQGAVGSNPATFTFIVKDVEVDTGAVGDNDNPITETKYYFEKKHNSYGEYYYRDSDPEVLYWYSPLLAVNDGAEGKATLYGRTKQSEYVKISEGTIVFDENTKTYMYTADKYFDVEEELVTEPYDLQTVVSFVFNTAVLQTSKGNVGVTYWYSVTTKGIDGSDNTTTKLPTATYTSGDASIFLVGGFIVYNSTDGSFTAVYTVSGNILTVSTSQGTMYLELDEENNTFIVLQHAPYTAKEIIQGNKYTSNQTLAFDGKGGAVYTVKDGETETVYEGTVEKSSEFTAVDGSDIWVFTSSDEALTFKFIRLYASNNNLFSRYNETYNGDYRAENGSRLKLDGFSYMAEYFNSDDGTTVKSSYFISESNVVCMIIDNAYRYFDIKDNKQFTARGAEYGTYILMDNQNATGVYVELDGYGKLSVFTIGNDSEKNYIDDNGTYTSDGYEFTLVYQDGSENTTIVGKRGVIQISSSYYNVFVVSHKEVARIYVNETDFSVLVLDENGGAVRYNKMGEREVGEYIIITDNMLYYASTQVEDACIYIYDNEKGVATPFNFPERGYYTSDLGASLQFTKYGFAVFNGATRYYYNVVNDIVVIYRRANAGETGVVTNEYGFVEEQFGTFAETVEYNDVTYIRNNGFAVLFGRDEATKDKYPVPISKQGEEDYKMPLEDLTFTPSGKVSFNVSGKVKIDGSEFSCTVTRTDDGTMYVTVQYFRFYINVTFNGDRNTYEVTAMEHRRTLPSCYYLNMYYLYYMLFGQTLVNNVGEIAIITDYDEYGVAAEKSYIQGTFGEGSLMYGVDGEILSFNTDDYVYDEETKIYTVNFKGVDGYDYHLYFAIGSTYVGSGYNVYAMTREETVESADGYKVVFERVIATDTSLAQGAFYSIKLFKDDVEIESAANIYATSLSKVYYVLREKTDDGKITSTTYYTIEITEKTDTGVGSDEEEKNPYILSLIDTVTVSCETVETIYSEDGLSFVDLSPTKGILLISNTVKDEETENETTYLYLITESVYDDVAGVYTVKNSAGKTFTVKISGEEGSKTAEITEVVEEEQPEESEQQPVEEQELAA